MCYGKLITLSDNPLNNHKGIRNVPGRHVQWPVISEKNNTHQYETYVDT